MPEISQPTNLIGYERRIREFTTERHIDVSKSKVQRLALRLHKRQARMMDLDLARILQYSDTTGETAAKNVDTERMEIAA